MIIDSHCHAGQGDRLTYPANTIAPLDQYLRRARRAGIDRTIVMPAFHSDYAAANAQLARIVRRNADRLIGFAFVHTNRDAGRIHSMIERAVTEWRFRGVKVHGYDSLPTREVCEAARRFRLPVIVDVVGRAYVIDQFAPEYRDVNFIVAHMGSFLDDWRAQQLVCDQLVRHANVYADTSGIRRFDYIVQAVKRAGPHKLIFGSDGPWLHPGLELHKIKLLGLPRKDEALITGGNIQRLMRNVCEGRAASAADLDERAARPVERSAANRS
jgi:predicted TIM-barrel fold metal-dependent hydrolase